MTNNKTALIAGLLILVKILYIVSNVLLLLELWQRFDFDRNINLSGLYIESVFFMIGLWLFLKYYIKGNPISFLVTFIFCLYFIPNNSCISLSDYKILYFIEVNTFCIILIWLLGRLATKLKNKDYIRQELFETSKSFRTVFRVITLITCVLTLGYVYIINGEIDFSKVFQEDTYDIRAELAEFYMNNTDGILAYMMLLWTAFNSTVLIIGFYISLRYKKILDVIAILIAYFALYTLSMEKGIIMMPLIAIFVSFFKNRLKNVCELFVIAYLSMLIITCLEYAFSEESVVYTLVVRRVAYMPAYLTHTYYDFFSTHAHYWFTRDVFQLEKLVRIIVPPAYSEGIVKVISDYCYDGGIPSPNTGLFAEAYAHCGTWGIIIFPPIVALVFKYVYKYSMVFGAGASIVILSKIALDLINVQMLSSRSVIQILFLLLTIALIKILAKKTVRRV